MHKRKEGWKKVIIKMALSVITTFLFTQHVKLIHSSNDESFEPVRIT